MHTWFIRLAALYFFVGILVGIGMSMTHNSWPRRVSCPRQPVRLGFLCYFRSHFPSFFFQQPTRNYLNGISGFITSAF